MAGCHVERLIKGIHDGTKEKRDDAHVAPRLRLVLQIPVRFVAPGGVNRLGDDVFIWTDQVLDIKLVFIR